MFGASIAIAEDTVHPENENAIPVGLDALLISSSDAASSSSSTGAARPSQSASSLFVELPALDAKQAASKEGFLHKIGGNVKNWKTRYFRLCVGRLIYYKVRIPLLSLFPSLSHPHNSVSSLRLAPFENERGRMEGKGSSGTEHTKENQLLISYALSSSFSPAFLSPLSPLPSLLFSTPALFLCRTASIWAQMAD